MPRPTLSPSLLPTTLAQVDPIGFSAEQRLVLAGAWVLFFLFPALALRAHAKRHGREWRKWFVLTLLTSVIGVLEYWEDKAVTERRAKRAARKAAAEEKRPPE